MPYRMIIKSTTTVGKRSRRIHFYVLSLLFLLFLSIWARTLIFAEFPTDLGIGNGFVFFLSNHFLLNVIDSAVYATILAGLVFLGLYTIFSFRRGDLNADLKLFVLPVVFMTVLCAGASLLMFAPFYGGNYVYTMYYTGSPLLTFYPFLKVPIIFWSIPHVIYPYYLHNQIGVSGVLLLLDDVSATMSAVTLVYSFYKLGRRRGELQA